jgi:hypothetical protein
MASLGELLDLIPVANGRIGVVDSGHGTQPANRRRPQPLVYVDVPTKDGNVHQCQESPYFHEMMHDSSFA